MKRTIISIRTARPGVRFRLSKRKFASCSPLFLLDDCLGVLDARRSKKLRTTPIQRIRRAPRIGLATISMTALSLWAFWQNPPTPKVEYHGVVTLA